MSGGGGPGPEEGTTGKDARVRPAEEAIEQAADPRPGERSAEKAAPDGGELVEQAGGYERVEDDG